MNFSPFSFPYQADEKYSKKAAYFSMEFAIDQPLKIYSGGLGFLAGSHLRSAYNLKQNLVGIGILWSYGYYDQGRNKDCSLRVDYIRKKYSFLEDTGIKFTIRIKDTDVWVKAYYLNPETFNTAPLFLLTTDIPENDYLSQTISHHLYDQHETTKIAQYKLLGVGGAKLLDLIGYESDVYHLNEAHGLPVAFYLYRKFNNNAQELKNRLVFTTHTPEEAGNARHHTELLNGMGFFDDLDAYEVADLTGIRDDVFNLSLGALRMSRKANGVSKFHGEVSRHMWQEYEDIAPITSITNAQDYKYWADKELYELIEKNDYENMRLRKQKIKKRGFDKVANQTGNFFKKDVFTMVWARRFAGYKRADLLLSKMDRLEKLLSNEKYPIQIIWAGKPYPLDQSAIDIFNRLVYFSNNYSNVSVLTGYELDLSRRLKQCADVWLNTPRISREASGTSGMTAAMNGALNFSTNDGWISEFTRPGENSFLIPVAENVRSMTIEEMDEYDVNQLYDILENQILPMYYDNNEQWQKMIVQSMFDVKRDFNSDRMAREYYELLY